MLLRPCSGRPVFSRPWWLPLSEHVSSCPVCVPGRPPRVPSAAACTPAAPPSSSPSGPGVPRTQTHCHLPPSAQAAGPQAALHHVPSLCMQAQRWNRQPSLMPLLTHSPPPLLPSLLSLNSRICVVRISCSISVPVLPPRLAPRFPPGLQQEPWDSTDLSGWPSQEPDWLLRAIWRAFQEDSPFPPTQRAPGSVGLPFTNRPPDPGAAGAWEAFLTVFPPPA